MQCQNPFKRYQPLDDEQLQLSEPSADEQVRIRWPRFPPRTTFVSFTIPAALATSLDIGLSNWSLSYITLSSYTIFKSTVPIFVFGVSVFMGLEKLRVSTVVVILGVFMGVVLVVLHDAQVDTGVPDITVPPPAPHNSTRFPPFLSNTSVPATDTEAPTQKTSLSASLIGSIMVLLASLMSGVRWALTQKLVQNKLGNSTQPVNEETSNTSRVETIDMEDLASGEKTDSLLTVKQDSNEELIVEESTDGVPPMSVSPVSGDKKHSSQKILTMFTMAPIMCTFLFTLSMLAEQPFSIHNADEEYGKHHHVIFAPVGLAFMYMSVGAIVAFGMVLSEYWVLELTSAVTLSIFGIVKEVLTVVVAALLFRDSLGVMNVAGLVLTVVSVGAYNFINFKR